MSKNETENQRRPGSKIGVYGAFTEAPKTERLTKKEKTRQEKFDGSCRSPVSQQLFGHTNRIFSRELQRFIFQSLCLFFRSSHDVAC
jgi:hypothetical protein